MSRLKFFVPNAITLSSLFCGFSAIIFTFHNELRFAFILILIGGVLDFLDGLSAKLLNAKSDIGAQLDSLSDLVTFGVAPAVMIYVLLETTTGYYLMLDRLKMLGEIYDIPKISVGTELLTWNAKTVYPPLSSMNQGVSENIQLNQLWTASSIVNVVSWKSIAVAALLPLAGAFRLAKFNVKKSSSTSFEGLAIPAAGLFIASLPLIIEQFYMESYDVGDILNKYLIFGFVALIAFLMILPTKMFSLKLKSLKWKDAAVQYIFVGLCIPVVIGSLLIKNIWLSVPLIVLLYIIVSLINNLRKRDEV